VIGILIIPGLIIFPITIGEYFASKIINYSSLFLIVLFILLSPITYTLILLSNAPLRFFLKDKFISGKKSDFNRDDLNELVRDSERHTTQDTNDTEIKLFKNALEFSEIRLRDCMIPRTEIEAIEINDIHKDLQKTFIETGFSKIIIYKNTIDEIVGYIKSKSLLDKKDDLNHHIKTISIFPETMSANKLLRHFIRTGQNIAVIVDEFGGTSGIITIEDILEEIFGEIKDEHDTDDLYEKQLSETDYVFSGRLEIDYLNEKYTLGITESDEYETIAGYILYNTEKFPQLNDRILIDQFQFTILKVSNTKLDLMKLEVLKNQS
jgi:CBS domain containing-hemolysin-like protein